MTTDGLRVARLGAGLPERPRAEEGWHQGPRIVFSAPPPWELNHAALSTVSEPGSLNHPWSPQSFQLPPCPSVTLRSSSPPPAAAPRLPWGCLLGHRSWGRGQPGSFQVAAGHPLSWLLGGLSVSLSLPFTLWLPPRLETVPGSLQTEARGGAFLEPCVTENVFVLASTPDKVIT